MQCFRGNSAKHETTAADMIFPISQGLRSCDKSRSALVHQSASSAFYLTLRTTKALKGTLCVRMLVTEVSPEKISCRSIQIDCPPCYISYKYMALRL